jgi:hypothetical protein
VNESDFPEYVARIENDLPEPPARAVAPDADLGAPGPRQDGPGGVMVTHQGFAPPRVAHEFPEPPKAPGRFTHEMPEPPSAPPRSQSPPQSSGEDPGVPTYGDQPLFQMPARVEHDLPDMPSPSRFGADGLPGVDAPARTDFDFPGGFSGPDRPMVAATDLDLPGMPRSPGPGESFMAPQFRVGAYQTPPGPAWEFGRLPPGFGTVSFAGGVNTNLGPKLAPVSQVRPVFYF